MTDGDDICSLVENHDGKPLKLYVYSTVTDACREVTVTPNSNWGGEGMLGCDIGYGYLHRIPRSATSIASAAASEAFTVTTGTLPHQQPVAGQPASPGADGFSEVPLGNAAPMQYAMPPGQQSVPMQPPVAQPMYPATTTAAGQLPAMEVPTSSAAVSMPSAGLASIDTGLAGLSLAGPSITMPAVSSTGLPGTVPQMMPSTSAPLMPGLESAPQMSNMSPLPSNVPPMSNPVSTGATSQFDSRQAAPFAAVSPLTGAGSTTIPSYATPANVTVVRGQASATISPLPSTSPVAQTATVPPSQQPISMPEFSTAPSFELPPMPSIDIPGLQLAPSVPSVDAASELKAPSS
eukprot:scpid57637/ scgid25941/ Golgi reassembly-stacking protein 2; Golgi phosphoprotein 6; Golgi reassembly-stacking protein of 55 kDa; p59